MKFRFTNPADIERYGPGWFEMVGSSSFPYSVGKVLKDKLKWGLDDLKAASEKKDVDALAFMFWASLRTAGQNVSWDEFDYDMFGVEDDQEDTEPTAEPAEQKLVPGVNPTRARPGRKKTAKP